MEDRLSAVKLARYLEQNPLAADAKDKRGAVLGWIIAIPDLTVTICSLVPELIETKKNYSSELFVQATISQAAFMIEYPDSANDDEAVNLAGMVGTLRTYQSILREKPQAKWPALDELLKKEPTGELVEHVQKLTKTCNAESSKSENKPKEDPIPVPTAKELADARYKRANKFFDNGLYQQAILEYRRMVVENPKDGTGYYELAQTFWVLKQMELALGFAKQAAELEPKMWLYQVQLGNISDDLGKTEDALSYYKRATELAPKQPKTFFEYAVTLHRLKRDSEAVAALETAMKLDSKYASPYRLMGTILGKEKPHEAGKYLRRSLELDGKSERAEAARELLKANVSVDPKVIKPNSARYEAYVAYAIQRAEWVRARFAERNPDATEYKRTMPEEFDAVTAEAKAWKESKKKFPAEVDNELDRLVSIVDAGFADAFVAKYMLGPKELEAWGAVHPDRLKQLEEWGTKSNVSLTPLKQEGFAVRWMDREW